MRLTLHLGRPDTLVPSPEAPLLAIVNHRSALLIVDAETGHVRTADSSPETGGRGGLTGLD